MKKPLSILLLALSPIIMHAYEQEGETSSSYEAEMAMESGETAQENEMVQEKQHKARKARASRRSRQVKAAAAESSEQQRTAPVREKTRKEIRSGRAALRAEQPVADSVNEEVVPELITPKKTKKAPQAQSRLKTTGKTRAKITQKGRENNSKRAAQYRQRQIQRKRAAARAQAEAEARASSMEAETTSE